MCLRLTTLTDIDTSTLANETRKELELIDRTHNNFRVFIIEIFKFHYNDNLNNFIDQKKIDLQLLAYKR